MTNNYIPPVMLYDDFEIHYDSSLEKLGTSTHFHSFYEIMLVISGSIMFMVEGVQYTIRNGDILLIHPGNFYCFKSSSSECKRFFLWINPLYLERLLEQQSEIRNCFEQSYGKNRLFRLSQTQYILLLHDCKRMLHFMNLQGQENEWFKRFYLLDFLQTFNDAATDSATSNNRFIGNDVVEDERINLVLKYIDEHLEEPLSLDSISSHFFISKYYLSSLFQKSIGLSVYQFIIQKRLANAYNMLQNGDPVLKACYSSGFSDYSNFLKLFKRQYWMLPKDACIRKQLLPEEHPNTMHF